jgi:hypothetical protein
MAKQLTKQYGWRVHTTNELMVSLQEGGGQHWWRFFFVTPQKLELAATWGLQWETSWFGLKNWT